MNKLINKLIPAGKGASFCHAHDTAAAPRKKAVSALLLNWEKASFVFYADFRWLPEKSIIKKNYLWY